MPNKQLPVRSQNDTGQAVLDLYRHDGSGQRRRVQVVNPKEGNSFVYVGQMGVLGGHNIPNFGQLLDNIRNNRIEGILVLSGRGLNDTDTVALANALTQNNTLTHLYLSRNQIRDRGAQAMARALTQNNTLTMLALTSNQIGAVGAQAMARALTQNNTLTTLALTRNQIGDGSAQAMANALDVAPESRST